MSLSRIALQVQSLLVRSIQRQYCTPPKNGALAWRRLHLACMQAVEAGV